MWQIKHHQNRFYDTLFLLLNRIFKDIKAALSIRKHVIWSHRILVTSQAVKCFPSLFAEYKIQGGLHINTWFQTNLKCYNICVVKTSVSWCLCFDPQSPNLFSLPRSSSLMAVFSSSEWQWNDSEHSLNPEGNYSLISGIEEVNRNYYAMLYSLLILAIVFGNVLVCIAVLREKALQTTTNYLVVSLAVADLLVASLVMPWAVYLEVSTQEPTVAYSSEHFCIDNYYHKVLKIKVLYWHWQFHKEILRFIKPFHWTKASLKALSSLN